MGDNLIYFDICSCGSFMPITTAYIFQWRRKVPKRVCGWAGGGGGGGAHTQTRNLCTFGKEPI